MHQEKIKVLILPVHGKPVPVTVENDRKLISALVGGCSAGYLTDTNTTEAQLVVCDGGFLGQANRVLNWEHFEILYGVGVVCGRGDGFGGYESLTDEQIEYYTKVYTQYIGDGTKLTDEQREKAKKYIDDPKNEVHEPGLIDKLKEKLGIF